MQRIFAFVLATLACASAAAAQETSPRSMTMRSFDRFEFDAATVDGFWSELAVTYATLDTHGLELEQVTTLGRLAYGTDLFEAGIALPYINLDADLEPFSAETDGIGDLGIYSKAVPLRTETFDLGVGMAVTFPTGDEDELLGAGETGFVPFASGNLRLGPADLRAHYAYRVFTGSGSDAPPQAHLFGFGGFVELNPMFGLRTEILGEKFTGFDAEDQWVIEPGVDVRLPVGNGMLLLRPTALFGLTEGTWDWGMGGSVAFVLPSGGA